MKNNKYAIETVYNGYRFRSRLEARWAYFFDKVGAKYQYEVEGYELPGTRYLPDFLVTLHRYNMCCRLFIEIKPDYPSQEEQYKAKWLANYTRTPVYIFFGQLGEETRAFRFSPVQIELKLLSHPSSPTKQLPDSLFSLSLPENMYLDLLQFYRIGCQLTVETCLDREIQVGCMWKNEPLYSQLSNANCSIEEIIKVLHLYEEMKDELKKVLMQEIVRLLNDSNRSINNSLPLRFLLQFVEEPKNTSKHEHVWVSCASCKHVGIYPNDFSHDVDCLVGYVKDGKGGLVEPDDPDEENFQIRQNYYLNKLDTIQKAYTAAKSARFEFGENS